MEQLHAAKRRKLETPAEPSQLPSKRPSTSIYSRARLNGNATARQDDGRTLAGRSVEAISKSSPRQAKVATANGLDIYDDIDGAHSSPASKTSLSTKPAKRIDPLRNYRPGTQSSPATKRPAPVGFFKQFHTPAVEPRPSPGQAPSASPVSGSSFKAATSKKATVSTPTDKISGTTTGEKSETSTAKRSAYEPNGVPDGSSKRSGNGQPVRKKTFEEEVKAVDSATKKEARNEATYSTPATVHSGGRSTGPRRKDTFTYTTSKKTFEDEIRELEEAAKVEAEKEDTDGTPVTVASRRRLAVRNETQTEGGHHRTPENAAGVAKKPASSIKASKIERAEPTQRKPGITPAHNDPMNVDEVEGLDPAHSASKSIQSRGARTEAIVSHSKPKTQHAAKTSKPLTDVKLEASQAQTIQSVVMEKLMSKRPTQLVNLEEEYAKVSQLVRQTVTAGESNSMLLIGARASGKTALMDQILREQTAEHPDDFHVVRLNGFIHTDDKIALREIWRQLGREIDLDEDDSSARNYADTLTTLLALLSHPAELGREQPEHVTKSVIFVLDEFELFASHPRQTLLYNLFDIAQSRKAPIAVLGLTTKIDVAEMLEKRVKSRFSHRYVHLSLAKSFTAYREACKATLCIDAAQLSEEEKKLLNAKSRLTANLAGASKKHPLPPQDAIASWNEVVEACLSSERMSVHVRRLYHTTKSIPDFMTSMLMPLATLPSNKATTSAALIEHITSCPQPSLLPPDSKLTLLTSLSTLQLALLICAARLTAIYNTEVVSFALAYEEYKTLGTKAKFQASASGSIAGARVSSNDVAKDAWSELVDVGLVLEDGRASGGRVDVGLEEIGMIGVDLGGWGRWCREI